VLKEDSCAFKNEFPLPNFKSSKHSPILFEAHVSYTAEVYIIILVN